MDTTFTPTRRLVVKAACMAAAYGIIPAVARASLPEFRRCLHFYNTHTGESLRTVYWEEGSYVPEALEKVNHILRDHRTNEVHPIDPHLLDLLVRLHSRLGSHKPFEVISGYRCPRTNAMLHARSRGVAVGSLHMSGKAIDIRLTDRPLSALRHVAWAMQQGGVGYYPASDFVHVDTGRVRRW